MYAVIDRKVNEIPLSSITVTILQYRFPKEAIRILKEHGCTVQQRIDGIYEISGRFTLFPTQVVDAVILGKEWAVLKILIPGATEEEIELVQKEYEEATDDNLKQHLADVLKTSFESNEAVFESLKEAGKMSEAVERVFKKEIEEATEKKEEQVVSAMLQNDEPVDKIVKYFGWTPERVMNFAKKIGLSSLAL